MIKMPNKANSINRVKVSINGEDYYIKGSVPIEHIQQVARYLDKKMSDLSRNHSELSRTKLAVLAALNITDELFRLKKEYEEFLSAFDEK